MVFEILSDVRILLYQKLAIYELIKVRRFLTLGLILMVRYDLIIIWYHVRLFFFKCLVKSNPRIGNQIPTYHLIKAKTEPDESDTTDGNDTDDANNGFAEGTEDNPCDKDETNKTVNGKCKQPRGKGVKVKNTQPKANIQAESDNITGHNRGSKEVLTDIPLDNKAIITDKSDNDGNKDGYFHEGPVDNGATKPDDCYSRTDSKVNLGCNTRTTTIDSSALLVKDNHFNTKFDGSDNSGTNILINLSKDNVNIRIINEKINISICKDDNASININKGKESGCNIDAIHNDKIVNRNIEKCSEEIANLSTEAITEPIKDTENIPSISTEVTAQTTNEDEPIANGTVEAINEPTNNTETITNTTTKLIKETTNDTETDANIPAQAPTQPTIDTEVITNDTTETVTQPIIDTEIITNDTKETVTQPIIDTEVITNDTKETVTQPTKEPETIPNTAAKVTTEPIIEDEAITTINTEVTTETTQSITAEVTNEPITTINTEVTTEPIIEDETITTIKAEVTNEAITTINTEVTTEPTKDKEPVTNANTEVISENTNYEITVTNTTAEANTKTPNNTETVVNNTAEVTPETAKDTEAVANTTAEVVDETTKEPEYINTENVYAPNFKFTPDENVKLSAETINRFGEAFIRGVKFQRRQQSFFSGEEYFRGGYHNPESDDSQTLSDIFNNIFPSFNKTDEQDERQNDMGSGCDKGEDDPEGVDAQENAIEGDDEVEEEAMKELDEDEEERSDGSESDTKSLDGRKDSEANDANDVSDVEFGYNPKNIFDNYENFRADYFKGDPKYDYIHYSDSEYDYNHRDDRSKKKQPKFHKKRDDSHLKGDLGALAVVRRVYKLRHATLDQYPCGYIRIGTRDVPFNDREKEIDKHSRHFQRFPLKEPEDSE
ncbi:hypothetical protein MACK_002237 [Theileria orientalis]|uniref:Uncharacterized protein n=1 Tax=Theileria orientalis TaxID=68886 RepID=A0A976MBW2_THEOR|nr:hypothetical protein MACK_002237 [Theileria orientalis]